MHDHNTKNQTQSQPRLTHLDAQDRPSMVDVGAKEITRRTAVATGRIRLNQIAYDLIAGVSSSSSHQSCSDSLPSSNKTQTPPEIQRALEKASSKGPVLQTAHLAAILASKQTSTLIPLAHPLALSHVHVSLALEPETCSVRCETTVRCEGKTGVEMEALTAVSMGLLTVWDMVKAVAGKEMVVEDIKVIHKSGGKSGDWTRED